MLERTAAHDMSFDLIKRKIMNMLEERAERDGVAASSQSPSAYWSDFCNYFDYMIWLPDQSFRKLRLHTYHLTGDNYQTYYFGRGRELFRPRWSMETEDIPAEFIIFEPEGGIGFPIADGKLVSNDLLRYQHVVGTLYRHGLLPRTAPASGRQLILEIGAGYGGLAHHLRHFMQPCTYVIIDLPETLLFSASYLSMLHGPDSVYLYDRGDYEQVLTPAGIAPYDFVLIPNYQLDALAALIFDLVVNVASLQEMRLSQVTEYLDFVSRHCSGVLYSWNQDAQPRNRELPNLTALLRRQFDVKEIKRPLSLRNFSSKGRAMLGLRQAVEATARTLGPWDRPASGSTMSTFAGLIG